MPKNHQAAEKTWAENEPERRPFQSQYVGSSQKEEKTQVVFITLTTIFVVIVIGCIIEVYRTNRAHKKRLERETDESIIWSKEQATKLMEVGAAAAGGKALLGYKPVSKSETQQQKRPNIKFERRLRKEYKKRMALKTMCTHVACFLCDVVGTRVILVCRFQL